MADSTLTSAIRNGISTASQSNVVSTVVQTAQTIIGNPSSTSSLVDGKGDRVSTGSYRYPADTPPYFFRMLICNYTRASWLQVGDLNPTDVVVLPIPTQMVDGHNVQWDGEEIGALGGFAMAAAAGARNNGVSGMLSAGKNAAGLVAAGTGQFLKGAAGELTGGASDAGIAGINAALGISINNFLTIMLKGPTYKQHQFTWKFSPNTPEETETLTQLYTLINNAQAPGLWSGATQSTFFSYPKIFFLQFKHKDLGVDMGKMLYRFKPCVLTGSEWNFSPVAPAFYGQTKGPEAVQITLRFTELEFWLSGDFGVSDNSRQSFRQS